MFHPDGGLAVSDVRLGHGLQQSIRDFYLVSGVRDRDGVVWLGTLECSAVGRIAR